MALAIVAASLAGLVMTACEKEKTGTLKLVAEQHHSNAKTSLDGASIQWVDGDQVDINGTPYTISNASVNVTENEGATLMACYPAGIKKAMTESSVTVTLPTHYAYEVDPTDASMQKIDFPLVSKGIMEENGSLYFKHLCAGVIVTVKNTTDYPLVVRTISLTAEKSQLCGQRTISLDNLDGNFTVPAQETATAKDRRVSLTLGESDAILAVNQEKTFQLPVYPIEENDNLTFTIYAGEKKISGVIITAAYAYNNEVPITAEIARAKVISTPSIEIKQSSEKVAYTESKFSIDANGTQVYFAEGDLVYKKSTGQYRFSVNQYTTFNTANVGGDEVDLFCYGENGSATSSTVNTDIAGTTKDWGNNAIQCTDGNSTTPLEFRSLTNAQWMYLLKQRQTGLTIGGVSDARYALCIIHDNNGILLFPDHFSMPQISVDYSTWNTVNATNTGAVVDYTYLDITNDWPILETEGCVFLVADGWINDKNEFTEGHNGVYWTGSIYDDGTNSKPFAYNLFFNKRGLATKTSDSRPLAADRGLWGKNRKGKLAVRLARYVNYGN